MKSDYLSQLESYSNHYLKRLIIETISKEERFKDCPTYLTIRRGKGKGRSGNLYLIYNFIDREEMFFYREREANLQFIALLIEAGYLKPIKGRKCNSLGAPERPLYGFYYNY